MGSNPGRDMPVSGAQVEDDRTQRPYLINFDATGSPCHELTSWDNSSSMSI